MIQAIKRNRRKRKLEAEKERSFDECKIFTKDEKKMVEIITKCDFSKAEGLGHSYQYFNFNNLRLIYDKRYGNCGFSLYRKDNNHHLKYIKIGKAKTEIVDNIIADKMKAYIENSIVSAFNNKKLNIDDCEYCGTKNPKDKINCVNCGAIIKYKGE